jgi:hypothetical protein
MPHRRLKLGSILKKRASLPPEGKHEAFGEGVAARKFVSANPTTLLDCIGAELLLIGDKILRLSSVNTVLKVRP